MKKPILRVIAVCAAALVILLACNFAVSHHSTGDVTRNVFKGVVTGYYNKGDLMCLQVNTENNGIIEFTIIEGTFIDGVRLAEGVKVKVESKVYSYAEGMRYTPLEWKR